MRRIQIVSRYLFGVVVIVLTSLTCACGKTNLSTAESVAGAESICETSMVITGANEAIDLLANSEEAFGYQNALSELTVKSTSSVDGDCYYRLQQNYMSIPVYGKSVVCVTDKDGNVTSITGNAIDIKKDGDFSILITVEQVNQAIRNYFVQTNGSELVFDQIDSLDREMLCIYVEEESSDPHLAYCIDIGGFELIVDTEDAMVLSCVPTMFQESQSSIGYMASDREKKYGFPVEKKEDDHYVMHDIAKGLTVYSFNWETSYIDSHFYAEKAKLVESHDNIFGNSEVEKDFQFEKGANLLMAVSEIQDVFAELGFKPSFSGIDLYYNDGFDYGKNALGGIIKGRGVISIGFQRDSIELDVFAHEYTHIVSDQIVNWIGSSENGALNEAFSDIFGEIIAYVVTQDEKKLDWKIHDVGGVARDMANPNANHNPSYYLYDENWVDSANLGKDRGGTHINSTVITHAAYLMWNGGEKGEKDKKISPSDLARLWYRAMLMTPADCNFYECRKLVELAATTMNFTVEQIQGISEAFDAVGIFSSEEKAFQAQFVLGMNGTLIVYGGDGEPYSDYSLKIDGYKNDFVLFEHNPRYTRTVSVHSQDPYKLNLPSGAYVFTISDNKNPEVTKSFNVCIKKDSTNEEARVYTHFGGTPIIGTVYGVQKENGKEIVSPIPNAEVIFYSTSGEVVETINVKDKNGVFKIELSAGVYTVSINADGYSTFTTSLEVGLEEVYLPIQLDPKTDLSLFEQLPSEFVFSSGAGGWSTRLYINADGTFTGVYSDSDMGDTGLEYPDGTEYICNFSGKFTSTRKMNEYIYSMSMESLNVEDQPGKVYYKNSIRYIVSKPYGLDNADVFWVYLPGADIKDIPREFLSWTEINSNIRDTVPSGFYGIYNAGGEEGFVGMDDNNIWYKEYMYYYQERKSSLQPSYSGESHLVFWPKNGASQISLGFLWNDDNQTEFDASDYKGSGDYHITLDMSDDLSTVMVTIISNTGVDLSAWGGTRDGRLTAEYTRR